MGLTVFLAPVSTWEKVLCEQPDRWQRVQRSIFGGCISRFGGYKWNRHVNFLEIKSPASWPGILCLSPTFVPGHTHLHHVRLDVETLDKGIPWSHGLLAGQHVENGSLPSSIETKKAKAFFFFNDKGHLVHSQQGCLLFVDLRDTGQRCSEEASSQQTLHTHPSCRSWLKLSLLAPSYIPCTLSTLFLEVNLLLFVPEQVKLIDVADGFCILLTTRSWRETWLTNLEEGECYKVPGCLKDLSKFFLRISEKHRKLHLFSRVLIPLGTSIIVVWL